MRDVANARPTFAAQRNVDVRIGRVTGVYAGALPSTNLAYINKVGLTQFLLRFTKDDNNDSISNYVRFYSGNATLASNRPVLSVKYYMP